MHLFYHCALLLGTTAAVQAATVEHDWTIGWVNANPDGRLARPVVGINGQWPNPTVRANLGDTIRITAHNALGNETTSLHWHGIHQNGTNAMDGPVGVTQCAIRPGESFTYEFQIEQTGTYWWHSHAPGQYGDGLRGPLIIEDPSPPYHWDEERVLTLGDWYHEQMPNLIPDYLSPDKNPDGAEPIPYSALLNEGETTCLDMEPGKTYYFRIINMATFSQIFLNLEDHNMTIIEVDGIYTEPQEVESLWVATAQRYGVLVTARQTRDRNYAFLASLDVAAFDHTTKYLRQNATGQLTYDATAPKAASYAIDHWHVIDDITLVPQDRMPLLDGTPDQTIHLDLNFSTIANQNRATWNDLTYISPKVPSIVSALTGGKWSSNPKVYGTNTNPHVLAHNSLVELVINNYDDGQHPIHLHGHQVQLVSRTGKLFGTDDDDDLDDQPLSSTSAAKRRRTLAARAAESSPMPAYPIRRDTFSMAPSGRTRLRFRADNPGVWLLHCHMDWHVEAGLTATFIEAPDLMQQGQMGTLSSVGELCAAQGVAIAGNAVGNTQHWLDLSGEVTTPPVSHGALWSNVTDSGP